MRSRFFLSVMVITLTACTAIIGTRDITYDEHAEGGPNGGDGSTPPNVPPGPQSEGGACQADLDNDKNNCGRCNHGCLGGACKGGRCQPVEIAPALNLANGLGTDGTKIYISQLGGDMLAVPKDGSTQPVTVVKAHDPRGVIIDNGEMFWASEDSAYDDAGSYGGIWKCTIASCTPKLLQAVSNPVNARLFGGTIYFGNSDSIRNIAKDGTGQVTIATGLNNVWDLAVDATYVYWSSNANNFYRAQLSDGGAQQAIGPLNGVTIGFVTEDTDNVYWTFTFNDQSGRVLGLPKSDVTKTPTSYGDANSNKYPIGVASKDGYLYWTNAGTFTDNGGTVSPDKNGSLLRCPVAGCPASGPEVLLTDLYNTGAILVDDAIYFIEFGTFSFGDGKLSRLAFP